MSARERILRRVREATSSRPAAPAPDPLPPAGTATPGAREVVDRFTRTFTAAGGEVVRHVDEAAAVEWLTSWYASFPDAAVSALVPGRLRPWLPAARPEEAHLAVSMATAAAAETGTLVLDSREGRRLQLLAPVHLVLVPGARLYETLGAALEAARTDRGAALGLHSGPSKSADIGGVLVRGVHGPGRLVAAIVG